VAEGKLRSLKKDLGIDAPHTAADGLIFDVVCREAVAKKADLIVAGRGRTQDTFGGLWSRLYSLVREARCPVLSI
jgi:nucleotide-binding universal stress UspA family protein